MTTTTNSTHRTTVTLSLPKIVPAVLASAPG